MSIFKFESMSPSGDHEVEGMAIGIIATSIEDHPKRQPVAKEFLLSVGRDHVNIAAKRGDGALVHIRLYFDGEHFTIGREMVRKIV